MTAHSKDEALVDALLDAFEDAVRDRAEDGMSYRPRVDGPRDEAREALRAALLSSSSAEKGMREALEKAAAQFEFYAREHAMKAIAAHVHIGPGSAAASEAKAATNTAFAEMCRSALSARAGEGDEQATRSPEDGRATASTDRLQLRERSS